MRRIAKLGLALPALLLVMSVGAGAQTVRVDFSEYASPTTTEYQATVGLPLSSRGLDFYETSFINGANSRNALATWGTADPGAVNRPRNIGSSAAMFATVLGVEIDIVAAGSDIVLNRFSDVFTMRSIDVAHLYSTRFSTFTPGTINLTFSGFGPGTGGTLITQAFSIPAPPLVGGFRDPVLTTLLFDPRWFNLYNVWWDQGTGSGTAHQFTNVVATIGVIPEPGTWVLMLTGLAVIGLIARRRRGMHA
jgi:hypothetical protein